MNRESIVPIYRQIYENLREAILAGSLPELTRLPPERTLAERLGVNRSTVVHAYRELVTAGLIEQRVGSGSRVAHNVGHPSRSEDMPWWITLPPWQVGSYPQVLGELAAAFHGDRISFVQGVPPQEPSPLPELARSFARVAGDPSFVLSYGDSEGHAPLREAIAARMRARGCGTSPRDVLVLTGSTQGITLVAQSLAEPGDEIVVEAPTNPGALQIFQIAGLRAIPVAVDEHGMRVDHVEAILRTRKPRFIHHADAAQSDGRDDERGPPRTARHARAARARSYRRRRSIRLARAFGIFAARRARAGLRHSSQHVLEKTIAPSLRLGWLTAPRTIYERLLLRKQSYDMATSLYVQAGVCDFLEHAYDAHLERLREELVARSAVARDAIAEHWPGAMRASDAAGGFYVWATAPRDLHARALLDSAEHGGATFLFGEAFFPTSGGEHQFRLAISPVTREDLVLGIARIGRAIERVPGR